MWFNIDICKARLSQVIIESYNLFHSFQVVGSGLGFYQEFFNNLQEGLAKERVQNSPSEYSAVVSAFMECLRFCLVHGFDPEGSAYTVQEYLIKKQVD